MKKNLKKLIIGLMIFISITIGAAFAGDSFTIAVSCTIPAIPGVNAPLIEEEISKTDTQATAPQEVNLQKETSQPASETIQQAVQEEKVITSGQKPTMIVKTIYDR